MLLLLYLNDSCLLIGEYRMIIIIIIINMEHTLFF